MTLDGTNTWLIEHGNGQHLVLDPGPLGHEKEIMALTGGRISAIFLTHRHADHSECAPELAALSRADVFAKDPQFASNDKSYLSSDLVLEFDEITLRVIGSPGHTSDSVAFLVTSESEIALFTGDTILGDGSSIITFPDGNIRDYLNSLQQLEDAMRAQNREVPLLPGHGRTHADSLPLILKYRTHRLERLAQIRNAIARGSTDAKSIVEVVYKDVSEDLRPAAVMVVEAQLAYLNESA
jgi:glyoxylase-like metal-dependent hydrolase (beta-lactamase superfamily II)